MLRIYKKLPLKRIYKKKVFIYNIFGKLVFFMQIIKNFSKPIIFTFHVLALIFLILAIAFCYSKELFIGNAKDINVFEINTFKEVNYSLLGTFRFSNIFLEYSNKNTFLNSMGIFSEATCNAAKGIKIFIIALITLQVFFLLVQLFNFRVQGTFLLSLIYLVLFICFVFYTKNNFVDTKLITDISKSSKNIIVFLSIACVCTLPACLLKLTIKKA